MNKLRLGEGQGLNTCQPPVTWKTPSKETPARPKVGEGRFSAYLCYQPHCFHTAIGRSIFKHVCSHYRSSSNMCEPIIDHPHLDLQLPLLVKSITSVVSKSTCPSLPPVTISIWQCHSDPIIFQNPAYLAFSNPVGTTRMPGVKWYLLCHICSWALVANPCMTD